LYEDIDYTVDGHVGVLTIRRPDVRNALRRKTYDELEQVVRGCTERVLVLTGEDPAFCSGDDVREIMGGGDRPPPDLGTNPRLTPAADALLHCDVPIVAAVNGAAIGWGMELALMADLRVASEKAKFGELFIKRGLCTDAPGIGLLAQTVGRQRAAELLLTGRVLDAQEALRIGLVLDVVPHDDLLGAAKELAGAIAANPPLAAQAIKRGLREALDPDWAQLGTWVSSTLAQLFLTEDHREGVRSFLEKREPQYVGR
jgi:enoyl-CoA hydratase